MLNLRFAILIPLALSANMAVAADVAPMVVSAPGALPSACDDSGALNRIVSRFGWAERTEWHRGFEIQTIENPRPSGHHFAEPGLVVRDYCVADSVMTNGSFYPVYYTIEHGLGFAGIGRSVDFCVPGLDPWHIHDGDCRTVR
jgi:hypothetical protein